MLSTKRLHALVAAFVFSACAAPAPHESPNIVVPDRNDDTGLPEPTTKDDEEKKSEPPPTTPLPPSVADALALARVARDGEVHTILVLGSSEQAIEGIDLTLSLGERSTYPLDVVASKGFAAIANVATTGKRESFARSTVLVPIDEVSNHVCTGINYADHSAETGQADVQPFLFPKVAKPTSFETTIERRDGELLDYEVELCVAFGKTIATEADLADNPMGFVVCNDVSERATQILNLDNANQATGKGYTDAKSRPGFLPLGPWVVVPKDPNAYLAKSTIALYRNGKRKQSESPTKMIWKIDRIVKEALALGKDARFELGGKSLALLPTGKIERGTLLMTGTPAGVILQAPTFQYKAAKAAEWIGTGAFLSMDVETFVKQEFVADLREAREFLLPGDAIEAEATGLGKLRYTITGSKD